jgi:hypothetical protein
MFDKICAWVNNHTIGLFVIALVGTCLATIISLVEVVRKPPQLVSFNENTIQNKLVWSVKNECYFVRPYSADVVYLIRVQDCDKSEKITK